MTDPLKGLNEQQQKVVTTTHGPLLVLAGAGSGKTRALTHRLAYLMHEGIAAPGQLLAVTFTNKAAHQMRERLQALLGSSILIPGAVGTFHSIGARILRETGGAHGRGDSFTIVDEQDREKLIRQSINSCGYSTKDWNPRAIQQIISKAKNSLTRPQEIVESQPGQKEHVVAAFFEHYEKLLAHHHAYDFDDLLAVPVRLLQENPSLRSQYQSRWQWISVDEYQDTNPLQDTFVKLIAGPEHNICVVGDDYQAIYSWRGATVHHILTFEKEFTGCTTIYLTQNYRSTPQVLECANAVIAENLSQKHKTLWTNNPGGDTVRVIEMASDRHECAWVTTFVQERIARKEPLHDLVILYRTNAQSRLFEESFLTQGIPYTIVGGFRFYERREVKDALAFLHFFHNPDARLALTRIASCILRGIGPKTISRWEEAARQQRMPLRAWLMQQNNASSSVRTLMNAYHDAMQVRKPGSTTVSLILKTLLTKSGYAAMLDRSPDAEERLANIEELYNVTSVYTDIGTYLEEVALLSDIDTLEEKRDRITCMTLHTAKGLEYPIVVIVGCEEGLLPHFKTVDETAAIEEERRLLYVGITRAKRQLMISYARQRYMHGTPSIQTPSRFLEHLPESVQWLAADTATEQETETVLEDEPLEISPIHGTFVSHPHFGRGVVIGQQRDKLTCVFEGHGVKRVSIHAITTR